MARRPFLQQVAENPRGWGEAPPPVDPQFAGTGELRSGNTPYGDLVATLMGPAAGPYASSFDRGMETASNLGAELTGIPQAARAGQSVEKALREFTPSNAGAAGRDVGLAALGAVPFGSAAARAGGAAIDRIAGALTGTGTKATIDPAQYQGILQALAGSSPKAGPKALPSPRGREGQLDPYNTPVNGVSPADVTRDVYARAAQGGKPTIGRGGSLKKDDFPEQVNAELRARTGDPGMTGLSREQLHKRRLDAEAQIDDMARREGLSYGEALQRYLQAEPTTELSGPRKGMRRNLPALSVAAPAALAAQSPSDDNPYRRIAQSLMGY